jgi:glutamine synthetase
LTKKFFLLYLKMEKNSKFVKIKKKCTDSNIEFISLNTLDLKGKLHSLTLPFAMFNDNLVSNGIGFDASSYGFAKTENSDMLMVPDLETLYYDPFSSRKTISFMTKIYLSDARRTRFDYDVRFIASKAESCLKDLKLGKIMMSPEYEFFIFKNVEYGVEKDGCFYFIEHESDEKRNYYHLSSPEDQFIDFKNEAVSILQSLNIEIKYHHHEVAVNQHEIETNFNGLLETADAAIKIKYVLFNLAKKHELFITFMPKPFFGKAGNGWHVHQYIVDGRKNIFHEKDKYASFSKTGLSYLSGLLFHSASLCALTNPSTNSYKRLVRGYEAPVAAIYALSNRNAAIRIPSYTKAENTRLEYRASDATSNPYLSLSAMLLAGIDGIIKNLNPEEYNFGPFDSGIPESKILKKKIRMLPESLSDALDGLEKDNEYLKKNGIFDEHFISRWLAMKREEIAEVNYIPHPKEFEQYFNF